MSTKIALHFYSIESASEVSNQHVLSCPEDEVISQLKCDMKYGLSC